MEPMASRKGRRWIRGGYEERLDQIALIGVLIPLGLGLLAWSAVMMNDGNVSGAVPAATLGVLTIIAGLPGLFDALAGSDVT